MNFYSKMKKLAIRGNIERMNDQFKDPYRSRSPIPVDNEDGYKLTIPGDENFGGGLGTRFRNRNAPQGWSSRSDEYNDQLKTDIPISTHTFISNDPNNQDSTMRGVGQGVDSTKRQDFTDDREKLPTETETFGPNPAGPFNLNSNSVVDKQRDNIFTRVKKRLLSTYL